MKIKEGVIMPGLQIEMRPVLRAANTIWSGLSKELVVTAALDGTHSAGSLHYYGLALDFRTHYFNENQKVRVKELLERALSSDYDVILHKTHIHVEYDPK